MKVAPHNNPSVKSSVQRSAPCSAALGGFLGSSWRDGFRGLARNPRNDGV